MRRLTTSASASNIPFLKHRYLQALCGLLLLDVLYSATHALEPATWMLENLALAFCLSFLVYGYRRLTLSDLSYSLVFLYSCLHEYGAQHTYARAPLGYWIESWLPTGRNDYDRLVHFCFGLLISYVFREIGIRSVGLRGRWTYRVPILVVAGLAAMYEMFEAWAAVLTSGDHWSSAYLGWQGDPWDSQKDMFASTLGACVTMAVLFIRNQRRSSKMLSS
jgi:putative membrane protein